MKVNANIPAIIALDIGGVVIPYLDDVIDSYLQEVLGVDEATFRDLWKRYIHLLVRGKISEREFWSLIESDLSKPLGDTSSLFIDKYAEHIVVNNTLLDILLSYKKHHKLVVFSNSIRPYSAFNHELGLYDIFDRTFLSDEIGHMKPDNAFYQCVIDELGARPEQIVFFDDNLANVDAARKAGIDAHRFESNDMLVRQLSPLPTGTK